MVALTGIEPDGRRFSSVELGLSSCVFSTAGVPGCSETPPRTADVTAQSQRSRGTRGAGEAVALLVSGNLYTRAPFAARTGNQPSEVLLLGTGWRNSLPVTVQFGGKAAKVSYAGASGGFGGLDQINVAVPDAVTGTAPVVVTTAGGASSRGGVFVTVQ